MIADPVALTQAVRHAEAALNSATAARDLMIAHYVIDERWTHEVTAAAFEVSRQRVGQLVRRVTAQRVSELGKAHTPAELLKDARDNYRAALHAQDLRCEAATGLNKTEVRAFYGDQNESATDDAESRVKWSGFYESQTAQRARYEENVA